MKNASLVFATLLALTPLTGTAQQEGLLPTQTLVQADSRDNSPLVAADVKLQVNSRNTPLGSFTVLQPSQIQVALLIDDGLSRSAGIQLNDLRQFAATLPDGVEVLVGYMSNGQVTVAVPFTRDHAAAAEKIRLPFGQPGQSASPYFCLSDFVKRWPGANDEGSSAHGKARFAMMITDGVDPYNGSVSITNQDSPYVQSAIFDAQRAGVSVSSIYYRDAGIRGGAASFSGQSYLAQVSDATGGTAYYQGSFNPVSLAPYFKQFTHALSETYVATFNADASNGVRDHLVRIKMSTSQSKTKLRHPDAVRPGNTELSTAGQGLGAGLER